MPVEIRTADVTPAGSSVASPVQNRSKTVEVAVALVERYGPVGAPATPNEILIGTLLTPQLRLLRPIAVRVERDHDIVSVWQGELEEVGYGSHLTAAIVDFQRTIAELYFTLRDDVENLGPEMQRVWAELQEYVEERH